MKQKKKALRLQRRIKGYEAIVKGLAPEKARAYRCPGSYRR